MGYSKHPAVTKALEKTATPVTNALAATATKAPGWFAGLRGATADPAVAAAIAAPIAAYGIEAVGSGIKKLFEARSKSQAFKSMLRDNPHLRDRDSKNTQRYFNTLWHVNPSLAKDPTVAGSFVHQQHAQDDEAFPHRGILAGAQSMASIRKDLASARGESGLARRFSGDVSSIFGAVGSEKHRKMREQMTETQEKITKLREKRSELSPEFATRLSKISTLMPKR